MIGTVCVLLIVKPEDRYCVCLAYRSPEEKYCVCLVYRSPDDRNCVRLAYSKTRG